MNEIEKAVVKLSAASQLPIEKVEDQDDNKAEQLLRARKSLCSAMGIHSFRKTKVVVARGPWVGATFTKNATPVLVEKRDTAKSMLKDEVDRLMKAHEVRRAQIAQEIRALLNK